MDIGLLLLRVTVGLAFAAHGTQKVFGWFGGHGPDATGQFMEAMGFRPGRRHALAAGYIEVVSGVLLAIGFLTPLAAALIASVMIVAVATVHWKNGFFVMTGGYEYNLVLGVAALTVAFTGPGALSIDHAIGFAREGLAWGLGAAAVAAIGATGQLAQRQLPGPATARVDASTAAQSHAR
jgi:putative oxidoreductase